MAEDTILLVEDNEDDAFVFRRALKKAGVRNPIQVVTDGQQAVDYLSGSGPFANRALHPHPFIVFLDLKLPYLSGFDVLQWIRSQEELRMLLVVVLTSSGEERDMQKAYSLGARSYLMKPPRPDSMTDLLNSLHSYWASIQREDPFDVSDEKPRA